MPSGGDHPDAVHIEDHQQHADRRETGFVKRHAEAEGNPAGKYLNNSDLSAPLRGISRQPMDQRPHAHAASSRSVQARMAEGRVSVMTTITQHASSNCSMVNSRPLPDA